METNEGDDDGGDDVNRLLLTLGGFVPGECCSAQVVLSGHY